MLLSRRRAPWRVISKTNVQIRDSSGTWDVAVVGGRFVSHHLPHHLFEVLRCSLSRTHAPRSCTEKISLRESWMICAQTMRSEIISSNGQQRRGFFLLGAASSLPAWDSAVARPCPSDPPISAARHFFLRFAPVRACQGFIPVQTKRAPRAPGPARTRTAREVGCGRTRST
jgi:hypothetical protein